MDGSLPLGRLDIAVVGSGISGLTAALILSKNHKITLYEKETRPGGHSNTIQIIEENRSVPVDTGFIVYNEKNYPNFTQLLQYLNVKSQTTSMSFSYSLSDRGMEYCSNGLNGLFGQRKNLLNPDAWQLLRGLLRFYKEAGSINVSTHPDLTVGEFLKEGGYSKSFADLHLIPMISAIWSTSSQSTQRIPVSSIVRFFDNHGLLRFRNRPQWKTVCKGSRTYVWRLLNEASVHLQLGQEISTISRTNNGVTVRDIHGATKKHDAVVLATHADQALRLLNAPTPSETQILGKCLYQKNIVVVHNDDSLMPSLKKLWSSWNVQSSSRSPDRLTVTYWMNKLQALDCQKNYFVSLNPYDISCSKTIYREFSYSHPILDSQMLSAQQDLRLIQGKRNTWFCGSYFGYGFHEDALVSAIQVAEALGSMRPWRKSNTDLPYNSTSTTIKSRTVDA